MCDHYENCEHCQDYHGELVIISKRCQRYRVSNARNEKILAEIREHRRNDAAYMLEVDEQVQKLKALNSHLAIKCTNQERELKQMTEAAIKLDRQCQIFQQLFCRAGEDEALREPLLRYLKEIEGDPSLFPQ